MEKGVQWTSENPNIVSVEPSEEGTRAIVSGVGVGTTKIIAESINHPGIDGIRYAYTVTVKPVVESVSFTYTDSSGNTSKGLTFNVSDNVGTMQLECEIFPEILQDTVKLLVAPHNDGPAGDEGVPSLKEINGTVNDYTFTPMQGLLGSYQYDIMQTSDDGLTNEVIDVLTINVRTQQTSLLLADAEVGTMVVQHDDGRERTRTIGHQQIGRHTIPRGQIERYLACLVAVAPFGGNDGHVVGIRSRGQVLHAGLQHVACL